MIKYICIKIYDKNDEIRKKLKINIALMPWKIPNRGKD